MPAHVHVVNRMQREKEKKKSERGPLTLPMGGCLATLTRRDVKMKSGKSENPPSNPRLTHGTVTMFMVRNHRA